MSCWQIHISQIFILPPFLYLLCIPQRRPVIYQKVSHTHPHTHLATPAPLSIPSPDHLPPFPYISDHSTLQNKSSVHYCQYAKVGLPWWSSSKDFTFQCRQGVGSIPGRELTSHMPAGQKTKTWNRSDTATNSVKDLRKLVHIEKIFLKTTLNHKIICTFVREVSQGQ